MIIVIIIFSILYLLILTYITLSYRDNRKNIEDLENRDLQLEKRLEDLKKSKIECHNWILNELNERLNETSKLDIRVQKLERKRKKVANEE